MTSLLSILACLAVFSQPAHAISWGHIGLDATNGTKISVDFQAPPAPGNTTLGASVYFNVTTPAGTDCNAPVRVVSVTSCGFSGTPQYFDLVPQQSENGCRFSNGNNNQSASVLAATHYGWCNQQLSVVVGGNWLKDKVNPGSSNFTFKYYLTGAGY